MDDIRNRLKKSIAEAGLSNTELAKRLGVSKAAVSNWTRRGTIATDNLAKVAAECGVSLEYLISGRGGGGSGGAQLVPVIGHAIASPSGGGYFTDMGLAAGAADEFVPWPTRDSRAYALRVKGDSMEPRIRQGELIVIEPGAMVRNGDDVLVKMRDGRRMVKRYQYTRAGNVVLTSVNKDAGDMSVPSDDVEEMQKIAGFVAAGSTVNP